MLYNPYGIVGIYIYDTKSNLGKAKAISRLKQHLSSDHRSYATSRTVSILMGDRLRIPDDVSFFMFAFNYIYITTVIVVVVVVEKERFPRNSGGSITNLCLFHETRTSCLMTTVSIRNRCKN